MIKKNETTVMKGLLYGWRYAGYDGTGVVTWGMMTGLISIIGVYQWKPIPIDLESM